MRYTYIVRQNIENGFYHIIATTSNKAEAIEICNRYKRAYGVDLEIRRYQGKHTIYGNLPYVVINER